MNVNFNISLKSVLLDEGGNEDDPRDHGGRTSRGITQREYDHWCSLRGQPQGDVWNATYDEIRSIYQEQYWNPYCDSLPTGVDYLFFDISVNAGRTQAVRQFQKALGLQVDGMMGVVTRSAIASASPIDLVRKVSEVRRAFYQNLRQFNIYGRGWINRVDRSEKRAYAMITQQGVEIPSSVPHPKATQPSTTTVSPGTAGTATGGLLAMLASFKQDIEALVPSIPDLKYIMLGLAVAGFSYMLWAAYKRNKIAQAT